MTGVFRRVNFGACEAIAEPSRNFSLTLSTFFIKLNAGRNLKPKNLLWQETLVTLPSLAAAIVIALSFPFLRGEGMYFLFLTAIVCSSLYGSFRAGIAASLLSLVICFLISNDLRSSPNSLMEWLVLIAFGLAAGLTVILCYAQKKSERAQIAAENRYRTLFEDAITGIYETTLDGRYTNANPKLAEMFGYDSARDLLHEAENLNGKFYVDSERRAEFIRLIKEQKSVAEFESEIYRRDGKQIWISENAVAVRDRRGEISGFQGTTIDITSRKEAEAELRQAHEELERKVSERTAELEEANEILRDEIAERERVETELRRSEEKFRALVEVSSEMIWEVDENTNYTYVSPKSREFNGYEPHEILGKKPFFLMPPEEAKRVAEIFKRIGENQETFYFLETITIHKDGTVSVSETSGVPFFDEAGNFRGYRGVARDVTERKRIEDELRESEKRLRSIIEVVSDCVWEANEKGEYQFISPQVKDVIGYEPEELLGKTSHHLMKPQEVVRVVNYLKPITAARQNFVFMESVVFHKNGEPMITESSGVPVFDETGKYCGYRGIIRDITERKQAENDLIESQKRLRALSAHLQTVREEERKNLARELHDELGQQLTALKIDLVRLDGKLLKANKKNAPQTTNGNGKEQISSMLDIVDLAMETTRKIVAELRPGVLDELGLAAAMEWQVHEFEKRTGITCELHIKFDEAAACQNLKTTVFRILQECLTNIARHSGAAKANITLKDEGWRIYFEVEDDGRGFGDSFESKTNGGTHSFGLLGIRERALLLKGSVEIGTSKLGGACLTVSIPRPSAQTDNLS